MALDFDTFRSNADAVRAEISAACKCARRDESEVELLAVTKTHGAWAPALAARYGVTGVGENRVQEAIEKKPQISAPLRWELIGHLQSNKAKLAATHFDRIQSVDSPKLLRKLAAAAHETDRDLRVLLQINAGNDPAKHGADPENAASLLEVALSLPALQVDGLMTIAPLSEDKSVAERTFSHLREIRDRLSHAFDTPLKELSMGMSGDLDAAIAAGSTQVRVGTALFGTRPKPAF